MGFRDIHKSLEKIPYIRSALKACDLLKCLELLFFPRRDINVHAVLSFIDSDLTACGHSLFEEIKDAVVDPVQLFSEFV